MDMLVGFIQLVCLGGLLYGLYLSITCVEPGEIAESCRRLKPHHFAYDPLVADAYAASRVASADRLLRL